MCFHLLLASPLTLSEVRSMLPPELGADLLGSPEHQHFRHIFPSTRTVARLVHGACSCDLVVQRHPVSREDEAWLRRRYRELGVPRDQMIPALEGHRRAGEHPIQPEGYWPTAVGRFVAEHARNAGPSLYYLHFAHDGRLRTLPHHQPVRFTAAQVLESPGEWLGEERLVVVC
jgi:hypothetical protein